MVRADTCLLGYLRPVHRADKCFPILVTRIKKPRGTRDPGGLAFGETKAGPREPPVCACAASDPEYHLAVVAS